MFAAPQAAVSRFDGPNQDGSVNLGSSSLPACPLAGAPEDGAAWQILGLAAPATLRHGDLILSASKGFGYAPPMGSSVVFAIFGDGLPCRVPNDCLRVEMRDASRPMRGTYPAGWTRDRIMAEVIRLRAASPAAQPALIDPAADASAEAAAENNEAAEIGVNSVALDAAGDNGAAALAALGKVIVAVRFRPRPDAVHEERDADDAIDDRARELARDEAESEIMELTANHFHRFGAAVCYRDGGVEVSFVVDADAGPHVRELLDVPALSAERLASSPIALYRSMVASDHPGAPCPEPDESPISFACRIAVPTGRVAKNAERWRLLGKSIARFNRGTLTKPVEYLDGSFLPLRNLAILAGVPGVLKTTIAVQWAINIARSRRVFGEKVASSASKLAIYVSLEDDSGSINKIRDQLDPEQESEARLEILDGPMSVDELFAELDGYTDVSLVIIDNLGALLDGQEIDGRIVKPFLTRCTGYAKRRNCAFLIIHHAADKPEPRSIKQLEKSLAGSRGIFARLRCFYGLYRGAGGDIYFGCGKHSAGLVALLAEPRRVMIGPEGAELGEAAPQRGSGKSTTAKGADARPADELAASSSSTDDVAAVTAAVVAIIARGRPVSRTGKNDLWLRQKDMPVAAVAGWPRQRIRDAVDAALAAGLLVKDGRRIRPT